MGVLTGLSLFAGAWIPLALSAAPGDAAPLAPIPDIAYTRTVLPNGLTLIVHEDHKAPIAAVNVWYHVGSKNEKRGKTGFAHLFEHLMFNGSEHFNDDYFKAVEKVGATDLNGTTNSDRTNYFQNVPTSALDLVLFLESDRMGHLLGAIDQARLDEQRGVVQNEKRQGENQPYGLARQVIAEGTYPPAHPYSWTTIGSMEDLNAASLDDVREWFRTYYGAANAVVVVAGDVDPAAVRAKVEKYFGDIPAGPPLTRPRTWVARMSGARRQVMQDRVPQARIYQVWNVPEWGSREAVLLQLAGGVLGRGKTSRLYKRLVHDDQLATEVAAYVGEDEIGSNFNIQATARPGGDLAAVEKAIGEELARFLKDGPTAEELARVKAVHRAGFIRGLERIGGFGGKSDILATNQVYAGDPGFYKVRLAREDAAAPEEVRRTAAEWLDDGRFILEVQPYPKLAASGAGVDRSTLPEVPAPPAPKFPAFESAKLESGLTLLVCRREGTPVVSAELIVDAGWSADGAAPGMASLTMAMLEEGTSTRSSTEISEALERLGADVGAGADADTCQVSLSSLRATLDPALEIFADVALHPLFPAEELERQRKRRLAGIAREKSTPLQMGVRAVPRLLFAAGHPYAQPGTGSGTEAAVSRMRREDLAEFHRAWFVPGNSTLVVVGDVTMADLRPRVERLFSAWKPSSAPARPIPPATPPERSRVYLIDRPGAQQSVIIAGELAPPRAGADDVAIDVVEDILGASFTSRLNMNLREDKHWSYGVRTRLPDARGQRAHLVVGPVQADKTLESMGEIARELAGIVGPRPITPEELVKAKSRLTQSLPGRWETNRAVAGSLADIVTYRLPPDYFDGYPAAVRAVSLEDANRVAASLVHPQRQVWVVVGDRSKLEAGLRGLGFGEVTVIDADGNEVGGAQG